MPGIMKLKTILKSEKEKRKRKKIRKRKFYVICTWQRAVKLRMISVKKKKSCFKKDL